MKFPGDCATPKETAAWMSWVAETEFSLPGILPVMTSCVELTGAWTSEGCLEDVPGFLKAQDHDSVGLFQQRPSQGWGTYEQCVDPDHSLRAFCKEAKRIEDDSPADTPEQLGAWAQAVQRSAYPDRYAELGYPMAKALLEDPERNIGFDSSGWALDLETNAYLRSDRKNAPLFTNKDGWLWGPVEKKRWEWPRANESPGYIGDGSYRDLYPDRYTWEPPVEEVARYIVDTYDVWCVTYLNHPPGYWRDSTSIDVWHKNGRGVALNSALHDEIFNDIFYNGKPPWIEWVITKGWIWTASGGWSYYSDDEPYSDAGHWRHLHITFFRTS